jgi:hypothetical protein
MPDVGKKITNTSLEGKTIALETRNYRIISYEKIAPKEAIIISDDYSYLNSFNWFYPILPSAETPISQGTVYPVKQKDLARVIFKEHFDEKTCLVKGEVVCEEIAFSPEQELSARLLVTIKIQQQRKDNTMFSADLIGFAKTSVGTSAEVELEISGPFTLSHPIIIRDEKKIASSATGVLTVKSKLTKK